MPYQQFFYARNPPKDFYKNLDSKITGFSYSSKPTENSEITTANENNINSSACTITYGNIGEDK